MILSYYYNTIVDHVAFLALFGIIIVTSGSRLQKLVGNPKLTDILRE